MSTVEVVVLECVKCGKFKRERLAHSTSDKIIMTRYFKGWKAKGYGRQKKTLCPKCANKKDEGRLADADASKGQPT
jgi:hypothetical protein